MPTYKKYMEKKKAAAASKSKVKNVLSTAAKLTAPGMALSLGKTAASAIKGNKEDKKKMVSAGTSLTKIAAGVATGAGVALGAYGAYTLADQFIFGGKLPGGAGATAAGKKRSRRMNPLNYKAATRATRRVKGAMDMLKKIEKQLPKQKVKISPGLITAQERARAMRN
mgnify:CR=1 FL=1